MSTETEIDHLDGLTDAQREAVTHDTGPCLVVAGAGSGKTRVITRRIVHLLRAGVSSKRILGLTFTNKAAGEMRERVLHMVPGAEVWLGTFHSFAAMILRQNCQRLNVNKDFVICDEDDRHTLIRDSVIAVGVEPTRENVSLASHIISRCKNDLISPQQFALTALPHEFIPRLVYERYQWSLRRMGQLDFDDLLNLVVVALRQDEELRARLDDRFRYVLVDEYQDTNPAQYKLLRLLTRDTPNLMVVGDPDQSIYKFRNADIRNILEFESDYPASRVVKLETNYRSVPGVLRVANALISHNRGRIEKTLVADRPVGEPPLLVGHKSAVGEANWIAEDIEFGVSKGRDYSDHAILVRVHRLTPDIEQALLARNIPYKVHGGLGFLGREEIKDILAYCRLAAFPGDPMAFIRIVNTPKRGVGKAALERLMTWANDHVCPPLVACRSAAVIPGLGRKAADELAKFSALLTDLATMVDRPAELVEAACERSGYRAMLREEETEKANERLEMLGRLCGLARQFAETHPDGNLTTFLERMALDGEDEASSDGQTADRVNIMTMHGAKGLEFAAVYLPGLENGILPGGRSMDAGDDEIEEERRTLFVGITRAMDRLVMSHCQWRFNRSSNQMEMQRHSTFLDELTRGSFEWVNNFKAG